MVSAQDEKVLGVLDLVGEQQADRLQRLLSSIDIVSQKQIIGLGWETTVLEEAEQVVVLSMDITYKVAKYRHWQSKKKGVSRNIGV